MSTPATQLPFLPQNLPKTQGEWQQALNVLQTWAGAIQSNQNSIGTQAAYYQTVSAETQASVTPLNFSFPPFTPDRYVATTGTTDMVAAIQAANKAAALTGASVTFRAGAVYPVNITAAGSALTISTSWVCVGDGPAAIIRRTDVGTTTAIFMAIASGISDIVIRGLEFDGQVTAASAGTTPNVDIGTAGSYNDNSSENLWSQAYGVRLTLTSNCRVENCVFINFLRAGLRIDSGQNGPTTTGPPWVTGTVSLRNVVHNCWAIRNRGIFGDGFIFIDVEGIQFSNCYAYDYQRIGFVGDIITTGDNGVQMVNCVADYGHDAVTSGNQSNVGFWIESGANVAYTNCESKNTSVGFQIGTAPNSSAGVYRPYTGAFTYTNCHAIRNASAGFKTEFGARDAYVSFKSCYAELVHQTAPISNSVGIGAMGYQLAFTPAAGGPNSLSQISVHIEMNGCRADMVGMSAVATAAGVNVWQGAVTNPQQFQINITGLSTRWLTSTGIADSAAQSAYETAALGYFGDIAFTGAANGGNRFAGNARITGCANATTGYVMLSGEISGASSVLEIQSTPISIRPATISNNGFLIARDCSLFDWRSNPGFTNAWLNNCILQDADGGNKDRTGWGPLELRLTSCFINRQVNVIMGLGNVNARVLSFMATGCEWYLQYPYSGGGEPGLVLNLPGGAFGSIQLSGNVFRNVGGKSSVTGSMIVCSTSGTLQVFGAGNTYDSGYVGNQGGPGTGHLIQYTNAPAFNDTPSVISPPFNTVNGGLEVFSVA